MWPLFPPQPAQNPELPGHEALGQEDEEPGHRADRTQGSTEPLQARSPGGSRVAQGQRGVGNTEASTEMGQP